jgi:myo-inositol catabolism protein IolC
VRISVAKKARVTIPMREPVELERYTGMMGKPHWLWPKESLVKTLSIVYEHPYDL